MTTHKRAVSITPNNTTVFTIPFKSIIVGTSGALKVDFTGVGMAIVIQVIAGYEYPINVNRVYATGTTATGIVGFY